MVLFIVSNCGATHHVSPLDKPNGLRHTGLEGNLAGLPNGLATRFALPSGEGPDPRMGSVMAYDASHNVDILFGGLSGSWKFLNDTWAWDGTKWTQLHPHHSPPPRSFASFSSGPLPGTSGDPGDNSNSVTRMDDDLVLFGGVSSTGAFLNDTWIWNGNDWKEVHPRTLPPPRVAASQSIAPSRSLKRSSYDTVLFGGLSSSHSTLSDTWTWDGTNWTRERPSTSPPARAGASIALGPIETPSGNSQFSTILYGGISGITGSYSMFSDTWEWNGANWIDLQPPSNPGPRSAGAMCIEFLPEHTQGVAPKASLLLFGGATGTLMHPTFLSDTWQWNGSNWAQVNPVISPPSAAFASLSPGPTAKGDTAGPLSTVLFGGIGSDFQTHGDTWLFDGGNWRPEQMPSTWSSFVTTAITGLSHYDHVGIGSITLSGMDTTLGQLFLPKTLHGPMVEEYTAVELSDPIDLGQEATFNLFFKPNGMPYIGNLRIDRLCKPPLAFSSPLPKYVESNCTSLVLYFTPYNNPAPVNITVGADEITQGP